MFSDRMGITSTPNVLQIDSISPELLNSIWNVILRTIFRLGAHTHPPITQSLAEFFFKIPVDSLPDSEFRQVDWLRDRFYDPSAEWWHIYNMVEFLARICGYGKPCGWVEEADFQSFLNQVFEREMSAYRFIDGVIAPISNKQEVASVQDAITKAGELGFDGVQKHLSTAIALMSQKPKPDYRNSIKESISSIESISKQLSGESTGGLEKALSKLDAKVHFHGAFKAGLLSLYGYTSDKSGIRHAILEETNIEFEDAKFMLISCSALVNFIISKATKNGLI